MLGLVAARVLRALVLAVLEGVLLRAAAAAVAVVAAVVAAVADTKMLCSIINCWPPYEDFPKTVLAATAYTVLRSRIFSI